MTETGRDETGKAKPKAVAKEKYKKADGPAELNPFGSLDGARCPLCRYPLVVRMTRRGPRAPCPCQDPCEDFAPLGPGFVMPPGTPGEKQIGRLKRAGILPK